MMTMIPAVPAEELVPILVQARGILLPNPAVKPVQQQLFAEKLVIIIARTVALIPAPVRGISLHSPVGRHVQQLPFVEKLVTIIVNLVVIIQLRLQVVLHSAKMSVRNPVQEMVLPIILLADHRNVLVGKFVVMEAVEIVLVMMVRIAQKIRVLLLHVHVVRHLVVFSLHVVHMISIIKMLSPLEILQFSEETA